MNFDYCNGLIYVIKKGDTLYSISRKYNVPLAMILRSNPYADIYNLQIGDEICIPQQCMMRDNKIFDKEEKKMNRKEPVQINEAQNSTNEAENQEMNEKSVLQQTKPASFVKKANVTAVEKEQQEQHQEQRVTPRTYPVNVANRYTNHDIKRNQWNGYGIQFMDNMPIEVLKPSENPAIIKNGREPVFTNMMAMPVYVGKKPLYNQKPATNGNENKNNMKKTSNSNLPRELGMSYVVRSGDSLQTVLDYFSISLEEFLKYNKPDKLLLREGLIILLPCLKKTEY